jgi:hypothetical protein
MRSNTVLRVTLMRIVPRSLSWRRKVRFSLLIDTTVPSYCVAAEAVATATESERTRRSYELIAEEFGLKRSRRAA